MSVRKSSHRTIFLIVSSGSPLALIASSLRSTSKKPVCPMTRSLHPPMAHCGQRVRFAATWREEFFEVPSMLGIVGGAALLAAVPLSLQWSQETAVPLLTLSQASAQYYYGPYRRHVRRVYRRAYRRAYYGYPYSYGGYYPYSYGGGGYYPYSYGGYYRSSYFGRWGY